PSFPAVVGFDLSHSLERRFSAHFVRPLLKLRVGKLNLPSLHKQFAAGPQCLEIMQRSSATFRFDIFGYQLIDRWLTFILCERYRGDECDKDEKKYETHVI